MIFTTSGEPEHSVFRTGECSFLDDLPVYFIRVPDFESAHSVITPAKCLLKVSKAADYRCQS